MLLVGFAEKGEEAAPVVQDKATAEGDEAQEALAATGGHLEAAQPEGTRDIQPAGPEPAVAPEPSKANELAQVSCFPIHVIMHEIIRALACSFTHQPYAQCWQIKGASGAAQGCFIPP